MGELLRPDATGYVRPPGARRPVQRPGTPGRSRPPSTDQMPAFIVQGGHILSGRVRPAGNKNAALPCITAALLTTEPVTLGNVPRIRDVLNLLEIMEALGAESVWTEPNVVRIDSSGVTEGEVDREMSAKIRASLLLAGPLLARFGKVHLPPPGGDVIGRRRMDTHFLAFEALGAQVRLNGGFDIRAEKLIGTDVFLDEPSVTGTENAIMAAVLAHGTTTLRNSASEPHVQDLCELLNSMGARITGVGTNTLTIEGVRSLAGTSFTLGADHIETGSFIGLAAVTGSTITIEDAPLRHLDSTLMGFRRLGVDCQADGADLVVHGEGDHVIRQDAFGAVSKIDDGPWPAFPADLTSIMVVTATQCRGTILIHEKMFESRMFFTDKLVGMGARIILCDPHRAVVVGPAQLRGSELESPDIRAGMALLIAALGAQGTSRIQNIRQIERGYERIDERLRALGAQIERED
jgi:UDP-N-acetylglucosamine 1-carboxyvinyltransferase